ncbi:hypothetical protein PGTUg99_035672 [Puccinia graminis f. sp. tritici]|uniref:Uncharacterized protein n=1 Tax=Puccinia graminis f. sp. tritici TaxID=56615 RepID=A0A5B0N2T0_PUCGR|nr:hypothetical protein PGTUg99_035672 [Puccinia graminis f. sp. tritici]
MTTQSVNPDLPAESSAGSSSAMKSAVKRPKGQALGPSRDEGTCNRAIMTIRRVSQVEERAGFDNRDFNLVYSGTTSALNRPERRVYSVHFQMRGLAAGIT